MEWKRKIQFRKSDWHELPDACSQLNVIFFSRRQLYSNGRETIYAKRQYTLFWNLTVSLEKNRFWVIIFTCCRLYLFVFHIKHVYIFMYVYMCGCMCILSQLILSYKDFTLYTSIHTHKHTNTRTYIYIYIYIYIHSHR